MKMGVVIPSTMRAIDPERTGGPDVMKVAERPVPKPGPGEVLIKVHAAGVNRPDVLQRMGRYPVPVEGPTILGLECAGEVVALGEGVESLTLGDPVAALVTGGAYAEYCVAPAGTCLPVPAGMQFVEAATLPETWFTVWSNLVREASLAKGQTLLVHGGTSGIGVTAIDLGKLLGCRVIVTCGTDEKCNAAEKLGADLAINYRNGDFVPAVRDLTGGEGVDVVLDMVGGDYVSRNLVCLKPGGRHVSIAFLRGPRVEVDISFIMRRNLLLTGSLLRPRTVAEKTEIAKELETHVWPAYLNETLKPHLFRKFSLEDAADAHRLMEAGGHIGKLALTMM